METDFLLTTKIDTLGSVELLSGDTAISQLAKNDFLIGWDDLYESCPWGTVFQSKEFVLTWYHTYQQECLPILVKSESHGKLTGLLTLMKPLDGAAITGAGGHSAEYHTWLSRPENSATFIESAIGLIRKEFPGCTLEFKYLPAATPLEWVKNKSWSFRRIIRTHDQPLVAIDEAYFLKKLSAKTIKEKIKRLKRLGDLRLERITDKTIFDATIDELLLQFDFRKGALYNTFPSLEDPLFKTLLLNLFEKGLLHVTVLKVNDQLIAGMVNTEGKNWVFLKGINTHAPFFAKQSPGLLHFMMLGKLLADEKVDVFDLTPGGDYYKDGLATQRATVHQLWLADNLPTYLRISFSEWIKKLVRDTVTRRGTDPRVFLKRTRKAKDSLKFLISKGLAWGVKRMMTARRSDVTLLACPIRPHGAFTGTIRTNCLSDLLQFDQNGSEITKWTFLENAMKRFEFGQQSFTTVKSGRLLACIWLKGKLAFPGSGRYPDLPDNAIVFESVYCHQDFRKDFNMFLSAVSASPEISTDTIYAVVHPAEKELIRTLESSNY